MATLDDNFEHISFLNTPARLDRINNFRVDMRLVVVNGEVKPFLEMNESVVLRPREIELSNRAFEKYLNSLDDDWNIENIRLNIETKLKRLLLYGGMFFEDEFEAATLIADDEIVSLDGDTISVVQKILD